MEFLSAIESFTFNMDNLFVLLILMTTAVTGRSVHYVLENLAFHEKMIVAARGSPISCRELFHWTDKVKRGVDYFMAAL